MAQMTKEQNLFYENYIIKSIDSSGYDIKATTKIQKLQFLRDTLKREYGHAIERVGEQNALKDWLSGLPSAIDLPFYNNDIISLAKKSGTLPKDATSRQEDKILENYWNFMANKIYKLFKKYKIKSR